MISVKYCRNGRKYGLTVRGHAQADEYGKDLICCAASTLVITLAKCVENSTEKLIAEPCVRLESGNAEIFCEALRHYDKDIAGIFGVICTGFSALVENYGEYICFSEN